MLGSEQVMAFTATADAERARRFYEELLGLTFVADEQFALVFRAGATMLRIQRVEQVADVGYTVLGWEVADLDAHVEELSQRGVEILHVGVPGQDERGIWHIGSGARVAWFRDPDGNILSLTQLPD